MNAHRQPIVAVPARNEERRLASLIDALGRQTWLAREGRQLRVVIVLNNCTDCSKAVAIRAARRQPSLVLELVDVAFPPEAAHVGSARRLATERALAACRDPAEAVLLTTDADAIPFPDWIEANLQAVAGGADVVGGRIIGDEAEEARLGPGFLRRAGLQLRYAALADRLVSLIDPLPHDPWPRHQDHTGASLAVRGEVFAAVGGIPALPLREDLAFVARARAAGHRLRHAPEVRVRVSARLVGRAPGGMADCLKDWMRAEAEGRPLLVEAPERVAARAMRRRALRGLAEQGPQERLDAARRLGLDPALLGGGEPPGAAALVERFAPDEPDAPADTPADGAIARIEAMIAQAEGKADAA